MQKSILNMIAVYVLFLIVPGSTWAVVISVPGDYSSIQAAIDAANPGDIVNVAPGTYYENIILKPEVTVQGAGAENTIIDGSNIGSVVTAENISEAKIDGFTITGGYSSNGGGIYCDQSSLIISNNTIIENFADGIWEEGLGGGGGIYCYQSSPTITHNTITENGTWGYGGGISFEYSSPTITHNTIEANWSPNYGGGIYSFSSSGIMFKNNVIGNNAMGFGGGIASLDSSSLTISSNTITGNASDEGGGIGCDGTTIITNNSIAENIGGWSGGGILCDGTTTITNNIITKNESGATAGINCRGLTTITNNTITENYADWIGGIYCGEGTTTITNSIIWGNDLDLEGCTASYSVVGNPFPVPEGGLNNINTDPMFVDPTIGDYHLQPSSLLIDAGSNDAPSLPENDFEGNPRIINLVVDIGADEVQPFSAATGATIEFAPPSPQPPGTSVTFTASGVGGSGTYEFRFWRRSATGTWSVVQTYGPSNTYVWNSTGFAPGTYYVQVDVRTAGSTANREAAAVATYVISGAAIAAAPASPQAPGSMVAFTGTMFGGGGPYEFRFWRRSATGTWSVVQPYGPSATYNWDTTGFEEDKYYVQVDVRTVGSGVNRKFAAVATYLLTNTPPVTGAGISPSPASPQPSGTSVIFTASGVGGSGTYEFRFWRRSASGAWAVVQGYSSSSTYTWNTTGSAPGTHYVQVDVRNVGSTANREAAAVSTYVLN